MECPHIVSECKINRELIKTRKCQLISDTNISSISGDHLQKSEQSETTSVPEHLSSGNIEESPSSAALVQDPKSSSQNQSPNQPPKWKCSDCQSSKDNWICLQCGSVLCGRYDNGHALQHFQTQDHKVCINALNFSVYCYQCDDFVVNEPPSVEEIRQELKGEDDSCSETSYSSSSSTKSSQQQETASVSSTDSGWEDAPKLQPPTTPEDGVGRKLRPRKRTHSNETSATTPPPGNATPKTPGVSPLTKRKKTTKMVGLRNLGNTCFMNSVLQSLSNIKEFSHYFNALPSLESPGKTQRVYYSRSHKENSADANVVEELRKVLISLSKGGDGSKGISPECLFHVIWKVVPQFRGHRQHDAHEFLRYMLDRLHTELQHVEPVSGSDSPTMKNCSSGCGSPSSPLSSGIYNYKGGRNSIVTNVFGGTLQSEVRCLICGMESKKHDPFLDLSLDIPEKYYKDCGSGNGSDQTKGPECNISDCLSSFTEVEELAETELYYCSSCKCKQRSTKRFWIRRLPNVLCLHIKRFRWNNFFRTKLDLRITFPIKALDMSQYVLNNGPETRRNSQFCNVYDLAAVIVHHGNGSSCGHYTSFAINNGTWLHFNDHTVKEVPASQVQECKPYILFYIRRDTNSSNITTNLNQSISKNL